MGHETAMASCSFVSSMARPTVDVLGSVDCHVTLAGHCSPLDDQFKFGEVDEDGLVAFLSDEKSFAKDRVRSAATTRLR